jgi:hypothetical protein
MTDVWARASPGFICVRTIGGAKESAVRQLSHTLPAANHPDFTLVMDAKTRTLLINPFVPENIRMSPFLGFSNSCSS